VDTSRIESMIQDATADDAAAQELNELLAVLAERRGVEAASDGLEKAAKFVLAYVRQVPYMMKVAFTAAGNVGLEREMGRILEMVVSYWDEGEDVIPDELGIIGLLDDAYCSLTSLQNVSDHYRLQTGKHLFPDDLTQANRAMRRIIGEPYATELDTIVLRTTKEAGLMESVKRLAGEEKQIHFRTNSTIWSHGPAGQLDLEDLEILGIAED
jgi:hypothetical protein